MAPRRILSFLLVALIRLTAGHFYRPVARFLAIDSCLDNGGRWDHPREVCDHGP